MVEIECAVRTKNQGLTSKKTRKNHDKIDSQTYSKKTPQKTSQNSIFTPIWASQNFPKSHLNRQKSEKNHLPKKSSNPSTVAELAATDSTPQVKPKNPPKRHPFT